MSITREKVDNRLERQIVTLAITNTDYLTRVHHLVDLSYFKPAFMKTVWSWISQYHTLYKKAPSKDIQELYILYKSKLDSDEVDLISTFLSSISEDSEEVSNLDFIVKQTTDWCNLRQLEQTHEKLTMALQNRDITAGQNALTDFKKAKEQSVEAVDAFGDLKAVAEAFTYDDQFLFRFQGAAGELIGDVNRTDFVGFLGAGKSGKSFTLLEASKTAQQSNLNVLFISYEMPLKQVIRRLWFPLAGKPKRTKEVRIPFFYKDNDDDEKYHIDMDTKEIEGFDPSVEEIEKLQRDYYNYHPKGNIKIACFPSMSQTVEELQQYVKNLAYYDNFVPDVIVIDYADLMRSNVKGEKRHQLYDIWATLRGWALRDNIAIVSASQAGRSAFNNDATEETVAEDISKLMHVTKMVAINSNKEERSMGLRRLSMLVTREEEAIYDQVYLLTCLDLGIFFLDSKFRSEIEYKGKKEDEK